MERARDDPEGDLRPFEALVERYKARVKANCRYLSKSASDANDLAQEVFLKVFFGLAGFEGRAKFRTWVYRIKANHCMNYLDKKSGKTLVDVANPALDGAEELHHAPRTPLERLMDEPPPAGFLERLRGRLHRRALTSQVATLSCAAPVAVLREFLELVFDLFRSEDRR